MAWYAARTARRFEPVTTTTAAAWLTTGALPVPQFPRYFRTIVNEGVARSLNLHPDDAVRAFARRPPGAQQ